jgi:hypothetical protein
MVRGVCSKIWKSEAWCGLFAMSVLLRQRVTFVTPDVVIARGHGTTAADLRVSYILNAELPAGGGGGGDAGDDGNARRDFIDAMMAEQIRSSALDDAAAGVSTACHQLPALDETALLAFETALSAVMACEEAFCRLFAARWLRLTASTAQAGQRR